MIVGDTTEQTERMTLKAVNEWLYYHGPNYNDRRAGKLFELTKFSSNKDKLEKCVAMLCRQIFMASDEVSLPYRKNFFQCLSCLFSS